MTRQDVVALFSGQGRLRPELLQCPAERSFGLLEICEEIGGPSGRQLAMAFATLQSKTSRGLTDADAALLVYGASIAAYRHVTNYDWVPGALLGQSFGEIAALACAGAFTVADGAEIIAARSRALSVIRPNSGYMAVVAAGPGTVRTLLAGLPTSDVSIAVENSSTETVIAGSLKTLRPLMKAASARGIRLSRLSSKYPIHCAPLMADAATAMARSLRSLRFRPLQVPVFSAVLGRFVTDRDHLTDYLADSLTRPVLFADALHRLQQVGAASIIDCSPLEGVSRYVGRVFTHSCCHAFDDRVVQEMLNHPYHRLLAKSA